MSIINRRTRQISNRVTLGVLAAGLAGGLVAAPAAAAPPASGGPAAAPPATSAHAAPQSVGASYFQDMALRLSGDDGVKGKIKNFTPHTIKVADPFYGREGCYTLVPPGGEVTYYNSAKFEYRDGRKLLLAGNGAYFQISRVDGQSLAYLTLSDPYVGRPDTLFTSYPVRNLRNGWSEEVSHHEITPTSSFWIKREKDGWNGGYETKDNSDWAVFTVHVDKI